jgi:hypothetical protein
MANMGARVRGSDRTVRNLLHLQSNASTARTLNLVSIWASHGETDEYRQAPFFESYVLNRSIIVKHRLRSNERDDFDGERSLATKIILPLELTDLRLGARSFFIGQRGYEAFLEEVAGVDGRVSAKDRSVLEIIDELPSLDPFLMRERLKRQGVYPGRCYFNLSDADSLRMLNFVHKELTPLIGMSFDNVDVHLGDKTARLAAKMLSNSANSDFEPLRVGMGMSRTDFDEGVFCWKGFIYYKWTLTDLLPKLGPITEEIRNLRPSGQVTIDERDYLIAARARLRKAISQACDTVRATLKVYDDAYIALTRHGKPEAFRDFLTRAPDFFHELGERLGAINHIISFWRFRFPTGQRFKIAADELADILADFEVSLSFELNAMAQSA